MINELEIELGLTKRGKPRKRKVKKKLDYFDNKTQDAILKFRSCDNQIERDKIYAEEIHHSFYKLVENIIHTFKFYHTEVDNIEDLKFEVISFLLQKLDLYKEEKGKAYSYFGTIAKRYLITYNSKNYNRLLNKVEVSNIDNEDYTSSNVIIEPQDSNIDRLLVLETFIQYVDYNLMDLFDKVDEIRAADAILELFKKREHIDIVNKKALFIYVREMTDVHSSIVTNVVKRFKDIYKNILNDHIENKD